MTIDISSLLLGAVVALIIVSILILVTLVLLKREITNKNQPDAFDVDRENVRNLMGDNTK